MKKLFCILFVMLVFTCESSGRLIYVESSWLGVTGSGSAYEPYGDLQHAIDVASDGDTLILRNGVYSAKAGPFTEELCGNCGEHRTTVNASRGFQIEGKALTITGTDAAKTTLMTNAGYGVLFLNSRGSVLEKVTITKGVRDPDGNATDAAVVLKFSTVVVRHVIIRDNTDREDSLVVGIGGIFGRENSELTASNNLIYNNGWDGMALYRGATAYITDNVIRNGRGVGIGITWDATAIVLRNSITGYWKGIGTFGSSRAIVSNNVVAECLGWGIIATGDSYLEAINNNVLHNGNCGLAIWSETCRGRFINNICIRNGWKEKWVAPRVGFWNQGNLENFIISHNNIWDNVEGNYGDMDDLTGSNGNISTDPYFTSEVDFHLQAGSPCLQSGSPSLSESDGSVSDMGMYGGPTAR